jgi:hypothetical protein
LVSDELVEELEADSALFMGSVSDVVAGVTLTGVDFSGKYNGPFRPQADRPAVTKINKAIRNIVTPERWLLGFSTDV